MTSKPVTGNLAPLPQRARNHKWVDKGSKRPTETPSGCEEHERECSVCQLVKITVHQPDSRAYRLWRTRDGRRFSSDGDRSPFCICEGGEVVAL